MEATDWQERGRAGAPALAHPSDALAETCRWLVLMAGSGLQIFAAYPALRARGAR